MFILQTLICLGIIFLGMYILKFWVSVIGTVFLAGILIYYAYRYFFKSKKEGFTFNFSDDAKYVREGKVDIYCGSDLILPDDYDVMGTRNRCLKKGVGVGMGMSDTERNKVITRAPKPGPKPKLYCGDKTVLPAGYNRFGNLHECLMKGVGVGARMPVEKRREFAWKKPKTMSKHEIYQLAHRFKIPTNQPRKRVVEQITDMIDRTAS